MTDQQPYEVVAEHEGFELRRYPAHLVAEVEVGGPFEVAGNLAFPRLARYIGGHNRPGSKVAMTAPVVQEKDPGTHRYIVGFVMPADLDETDLPEPADPGLRTRAVPAHTAAAVRFSGPWLVRRFDRRAEQLLVAVDAVGLAVAGPVRYARFDPPWTPWFLRRNEVVVPVLQAPGAS